MKTFLRTTALTLTLGGSLLAQDKKATIPVFPFGLAPALAATGKDIANPLGSILSAAMLLDHFGLHNDATKIREAANWTLQNGFVTKDIDPINFYFTSTIGELISDYVGGKFPGDVHKDNIELRKSTII